MWPFTDNKTQKGVSIILLIGGLLTLFFPTESIPNSFMVSVVLMVLGAVYLIDLE